MQRFLIVTADDFGRHTSINAAIQLAHKQGILTAASLMVGAPAAQDAVRRARFSPHLRVGLHVVLTDGVSVLPPAEIPDLVDERGLFTYSMVRNGFRFYFNSRIRRQLEAEIHAQFEAFWKTGLQLDHVNAHKHFHLHPTILNMILGIGPDYGMRAVRVPYEPTHSGQPLSARVGATLLTPCIRIMRHRLRTEGHVCNDQLYGMHFTGSMDENRLLAVLNKLPEGVTEIYLHPAIATNAELGSEPRYRHQDELSGLLSNRVRDVLQSTGVTCGGYADLPPLQSAP